MAESRFKNKVVFVGAAATASVSGAKLDQFPTPYTRINGRQSAGVEVHATQFLNLVRGDFLLRLSGPFEFLILFFAGTIMGLPL